MQIPGKIIFKALVGSHAYGTNVEGSDEDYKGIYIQDPKDVFIEGYKPQIEVSKDEVYFELGRFLELLGSANPTVLELLYSPDECVLVKEPLFEEIIKERTRFITKQCRHSFAGYAISQIKKAGGLEKKMNWEVERKERKDILDFCYVFQGQGSLSVRTWLGLKGFEQRHCGLTRIEHMRNCFAIYHHGVDEWHLSGPTTTRYKGLADEDSNDLKTDTVHRDEVPLSVLYFNLEAYQQHCKEYNEYQDWLEKRNTQRYVDIEGHGQKIDGKNLLHCVRLIDVGMEIALEKKVVVRRPNADYLVEIRKGKHDLQSILDECELKLTNMNILFDECSLPHKVDQDWLGEFSRQLKEKWYDTRRKE